MVTMSLNGDQRLMSSRRSVVALRSLMPVVAYLSIILSCVQMTSSLVRLFETTIGLILVLKLCALIQIGYKNLKLSVASLLTYFLLWPGMNPIPFQKQENVDRLPITIEGIVYMVFGIGLSFAAMISLLHFNSELAGWLGIVALLTTIHLGFSNLLTTFIRKMGWNVKPLFVQPLKSLSLNDFWSHRWNIAFIEMDRMLFLRPLFRLSGRDGAIFGTFIISGLLHELAISFSSGGGYGLPLLYFVLQGLLVMTEPKIGMEHWPIVAKRIWTGACLILPLPLLFHSHFRSEFIVPLYQNLNSLFL
jgi:hypothetical protein